MKCLCGVGLAGSSLYGNPKYDPIKLKRASRNIENAIIGKYFGFRSNPTSGICLKQNIHKE